MTIKCDNCKKHITALYANIHPLGIRIINCPVDGEHNFELDYSCFCGECGRTSFRTKSYTSEDLCKILKENLLRSNESPDYYDDF